MYAAGATEWVASRSVDRSKILANGSEPKRRPFVDGFVMTLSNRLGTETAVKTPEATDHILWDPCIHSTVARVERKVRKMNRLADCSFRAFAGFW